MPKRVSLVILCEDEMHQRFINAFLHRVGMPSVGRARLERMQSKSAVFEAFPREVRALRKAHVQTRLIVVVDGDELTDAQINDRLRRKLRESDLEDTFEDEPVLIVRPRWEMENWALHLLGESIEEDHRDDARKNVGDRGRDAGRILADGCKARRLPVSPLPSMKHACIEWEAHRNRWNY
ncbi:MAG TPA: hypothetical protein VG944_07100 [Fimbriimonas sp.]|nr:hypothetical protein [Fimbriimonas sp.]